MALALAAAAPAHAADEIPGWYGEAVGRVPAGWVAGRVYRMDEAASKAFIAVFAEGADHPMTPGNAFDPGQVLEVTLKRDGNGFAYASSTIYARSPGDRLQSGNEDYHAEILARLYGQAEAEPDVMPCQIRGWAASDSRLGTPVRVAPDDAAAIVGRLAPPVWDSLSEAVGPDGLRAEFDITGYRDGWFRIENASPPGRHYDHLPPEGHPPTYSGTGWIRVTEALGAYANTQMPVMRLLQYPHVDAADYPPGEGVAGPDGTLSIDGTLMRLHACSANWALTTARDLQRGWWRGICSNQVTNCS